MDALENSVVNEETDQYCQYEKLPILLKVVSLYEVERVCLSAHSLIEACRVSYIDNPLNFGFSDFPPKGSKFVNKDYLAFKGMFTDRVMEIVSEMQSTGAI